MATTTKRNPIVDSRGIGKPGNFRGDEAKYQEWKVKLNAYLRVSNSKGLEMVEVMCKSKETFIDDLDIDNYAQAHDLVQDHMHEFSNILYALLVTNTEEDAFRIVNSVTNGSGIEAYRLLRKRFESQTPGTRRALLNSIINNPQCKKVNEVERNLMNLEELVKRYESITGTTLQYDLVVTVMIDLCNKDLREHLEMRATDMKASEVRDDIRNYVERKRDVINSQVKAMEVDNVEQSESWKG